MKKIIDHYTYDGYFDILFGGYCTEIAYPLYNIAKRKNKKCVWFDLDDGFFSAADFVDYYTWKSKLLLKIFNIHFCTKERKGIWLYNPETYAGKTNVKIYECPPIRENTKLQIVLNELFGVTIENIQFYNRQKIFFLEENSEHKGLRELEKRLENATQEVCENTYFKPKPTSDEGRRKKNNYPMEIIAMNCDLNSKIIISRCSTGCFSPIIHYNAKPNIILTYKLYAEMESEQFLEQIDCAINQLAELYNARELISIPKTEAEYIHILKNLVSVQNPVS